MGLIALSSLRPPTCQIIGRELLFFAGVSVLLVISQLFSKVSNRQASLFDCQMAVMQVYDMLWQSPGSVWRIRTLMRFFADKRFGWVWCGIWFIVLPLLLWAQRFWF